MSAFSDCKFHRCWLISTVRPLVSLLPSRYAFYHCEDLHRNNSACSWLLNVDDKTFLEHWRKWLYHENNSKFGQYFHEALRELAEGGCKNTTDLFSRQGVKKGYIKLRLNCGPKRNINWLILDFQRASQWQAILGDIFPGLVLETVAHFDNTKLQDMQKRLQMRASAAGLGKVVPTDFQHFFDDV